MEEKNRCMELTAVLERLQSGDRAALEDLMSLVYFELKGMARNYMQEERPDHTLQTTALVNELYLKVNKGEELGWENRAHFFGAAARAMRQILVDYARRVQSQKRGVDWGRTALRDITDPGSWCQLDFLALDEALTRLRAEDERKAQVVELRFFAGLSVEDVAQALDVSDRTVARDWRYALAWLSVEMSGDGGPAIPEAE